MEERQGRAKTSVNLDRDLYRQLRVFAAQHDRRVADVIEEALRRYLEQKKESES